MIRFAPRSPIIPGCPTYMSSFSSNISIVFHVVSTGIFNRSSNSYKKSVAPAKLMPFPARIRGFFDFRTNSIVLVIFSFIESTSSFLGSYPLSSFSFNMNACTSNGRSIHTGPCLPVVASCHARSKWYRISFGSITCTAYFVMGVIIGTICTS